MDEDKFALVEKIIKDIDNVMSKNAELYAFDIVPVDMNFRNKSPVVHLENCLGLESWCVKHVYVYCYNELMDKYFPKQKRKSFKLTSVSAERLIKLLNVTLLLNPELSSLWNKRRDMKCFVEKSRELQFAKIVLSRKPKCNEAFAYRRWLLESIFKDDSVHTNQLENLINQELQMCELASDRCPNNYHSWNHRMWVVNTLSNRKQYDTAFLFIKEYGFSERWASKHVSDFSCFHYRQFCIKNIFTIDNANWKTFESTIDTNLRKSLVCTLSSHFPEDTTIQASEDNLLSYSEDNLVNLLLSYTNVNCNCVSNHVQICRKIEILFYELVLNNELLKFYKYHETLWYHRRYIVHELINLMHDYYGVVRQNGVLVKKVCKECNLEDIAQKQTKMVRYDCNRVYTCVLFNVLISHEKKFVEERISDGDNYADRHVKYMKFVKGLNNVM